MNTQPNDGGPAFPCHPGNISREGMSLRDYFARNAPQDEVCEMSWKHLSVIAQERLAGMKRPIVNSDARGEDAADNQIALMVFHARVCAALRYISADAMIEARGKEES